MALRFWHQAESSIILFAGLEYQIGLWVEIGESKMGAKESLLLVVDEKGFTFETGMLFRGMTISQKGESWNVVIRARDPDGTPLYAITEGESIEKAFSDLWSTLYAKEAQYFWRLDTWAK